MLEQYSWVLLRIKAIGLDNGNVSDRANMPVRRNDTIKGKKLLKPRAIKSLRLRL